MIADSSVFASAATFEVPQDTAFRIRLDDKLNERLIPKSVITSV